MMTTKQLESMAQAINECFTEPFGFPEGFIQAKAGAEGINLRIGARDITIDPKGVPVGQGTRLQEQQWTIGDK